MEDSLESELEKYTGVLFDSIEHIITLKKEDPSDLAFIIDSKLGDTPRKIAYLVFFSSSDNLRKLVSKVVETFQKEYKKDQIIFFSVPLSDRDFKTKIYQIIKYGFMMPGILLDREPEFIVSRKNRKIEKSFMNTVHIKNVKAVLDDFHHWKTRMSSSLPCTISVTLEEKTRKQLSKMVHSAKKSGEGYQEYSGVLVVSEVKHSRPTSVYILSINKEHTLSGDNNSVDGVDKCFTFHTHPLGEYKKIDVKCAWPSRADISTIFSLITESIGVMHILAALEGIYYISINPSWANRTDELKSSCDECMKIYEIPYPENDSDKISTPEEYMAKVNTSDAPFQIQFREWNDSTPVSIATARTIQGDVMSCKCEM